MLISKKNEVYLTLSDLSPALSQELTDFFTFEVPNAKFMPMVRKRMWDGKIRLFSPASGEIYVGLLPYIKEYCNSKNVKYKIEEGVEDERNVVDKVVRGFIKSLKPRSGGKSLKIRDYQIEAVRLAISRNRSLIVSPTASGKSLIIYSLVRYYQMAGHRTLILVPTTSLVEQMYTDFEDYGWSAGTYCQKVYQGYTTKIEKDVVISTWQSIYKMPKKYFEQFGCVIGDEAHTFKSKSLTSIMNKLHLCKYRFGLTGTLDDLQTHKLVLEGVFGAVNKVISTKELIDKKTLSNLKIDSLILGYNDNECKIVKDLKYADEIDYIVRHKPRLFFVNKLLSPLKGNTLVLYQFVEKHGKPLYDLILNTYKDRKVFFVSGDVDALTREKIRAITEKSSNAIIVASYGTFSTGINIKNLHNIIFSSPSKSKIRVLQSIGRGLRLGDNKNECKLFDIADDFTYKSRQNFTLQHFMERINIYNQEQFDYTIHRIKL